MKKIVKFILYKILRLFPRTILVNYAQSFFDKNDNSFLINIIRDFLGECYKSGETSTQKNIGFTLWRSKAATNYLSNRIVPDYIVEKFSSIVLKYPDYDVCEIGTGNGYLIDVMSRKMPERKFIGVDLNERQIADNIYKYKNNGSLQFVCADAVEYIKKFVFDKTIFISYVSLTTFTPEAVQFFFESIAKKEQPSFLIICEANRFGVAESNKSELRGNLAYSHNYTTLAKKFKFDILETYFSEQNSLLWLVCYSRGVGKK